MSDKPITIDGVTYHPRWDWSPQYRAEFKTQVSICGDPSKTDEIYIQWYAGQHGITVDQARMYLKENRKALAGPA